VNLNDLRINASFRTNAYYSFSEKHKLKVPDYDRCYFTCVEVVCIASKISVIFLGDNKRNLTFFIKKSGEDDSIK
jgi:hypothetical protein